MNEPITAKVKEYADMKKMMNELQDLMDALEAEIKRAKAVSGEVLQWSVLAAAWLSIGLDAPLWVPLAATGVFVAKSVLELYLMIRYEREM